LVPLEIIDGMGHNFPVELWPQIIDKIADHVRQSSTET
jgi:hypothetical protein